MVMGMRVALYGGSFNPIHHGHLIAARAVVEQRHLTRVIFLPSQRPPHKRPEGLIAAEHRAAMVRLAIAGEKGLEFSDFDLNRPGPSYTIDTVLHFRALLAPGSELFWIIGGDSLFELTTWKRLPELVDACQILTARRAGSVDVDWSIFGGILTAQQVRRLQDGVVPTPIIDISSTDVRNRLRDGLSVRYLVPDSVSEYLSVHRLGTNS